MAQSSRQLAFLALKAIHKGGFADVVLDKTLNQTELTSLDRRFVTELVYGTIRRQRTLDALIDQLATRPAHNQPSDLRLLLHLGLYQLRFLDQVPASAAVNTTVDLAKQNGFAGLAGFVNGLLRQYLRLQEQSSREILQLPTDPVQRLGILHSFPDWIIQVWLDQLDLTATEQLCQWMNQPPHLDLRLNPLRTTLETLETALTAKGIIHQRRPPLPQALRLQEPGRIDQIPGFAEGWWMVQDSSAQLVSYLVDPQPGEVVVDACAAPGGKTLHLAELMQDRGVIWACDRTPSRLKKLQQNLDRLGFKSIKIHIGDSREATQFVGQCDRVLLDAPCSGLGTLNRHADARWRQTPDNIQELAQLQRELLSATATYVKPGGTLVYATCTLHPAENEQVIQSFLQHHPDWRISPPTPDSPPAAFATPAGWVKVWPQQQDMDGFFMVRLQKATTNVANC